MSLVRKFLMGVSLSLMGWSTNAASQPDCPPTPTVAQVLAAATGRDHGFMWQIQKAGRVSFLYGTIHLSRLEWAYPGPRVLAALRASDVVALELTLLEPHTLQAIAADTSMQGGGHDLPAPLAERLQAAASRACVPPEILMSREPMLQLFVTARMGSRQDGLYPELAMDLIIAGLAKAMNKRIAALETASDQIAALRPPTGQQDVLLAQQLDQIESGSMRATLLRIGEAWAEGDEKGLTGLTGDTAGDREMSQRLVDGRNPNMAQRIADLHDRGARVFAAVGTQHMFGPRGLVELLRARGFTVERVPFGGRVGE